jgi:hypothetical protein
MHLVVTSAGATVLCVPAALQLLASQVLNPRSIDVSLDDIGGLHQVKEDMVRGIAAPFMCIEPLQLRIMRCFFVHESCMQVVLHAVTCRQ